MSSKSSTVINVRDVEHVASLQHHKTFSDRENMEYRMKAFNNSNKISISYNDTMPSLVSALPSDATDGNFHRHILKIKISPTLTPQSEINCNNNKKMSIVSIKRDDFDENLSDDQKLVLNVSCGKKKMINLGGNLLLSGHCSPECSGGEDHLDSGTCSDVEANNPAISDTPPPLPPKTYKKNIKLSESTCSDASSSASSSDSMQYHHQLMSPDLIRSIEKKNNKIIPTSLLCDIRNRSIKTFHEDEHSSSSSSSSTDEDFELNYSEIVICEKPEINKLDIYDDDKFYKFHINEHLTINDEKIDSLTHEESDESFAGYKDLSLRSGTSTIRSAKGTIRGVKNRVKNGIATFLQMQQTTVKNYKDKDGGKIVLYSTSMGIVRSTYAKCQAVKQILRTLMVKFEERDVFMSYTHQKEIRDRMQSDDIDVPQLFVDGHYIGNADQTERLNESGELRIMLKPFKCRDSHMTCKMCGGYKMLPCPSCGGSKKSVHRNHFTTEFIALKCMNCDEVGLVKCYNCA